MPPVLPGASAPRTPRHLPAASALVLSMFIAACGSGGGDGGSAPAPVPPVSGTPDSSGDLSKPPSAEAPLAASWLNFGRDPQHAAQTGGAAAQPITRMVWRSDIDLQPSYRTINGAPTANLLDTGHYGSPVITRFNTVIVPVKVTSAGTYRIEARNGNTGALRWQSSTDYVPPTARISFNAALTAGGRVYFPGAGGKLWFRDSVDTTPGPLQSVAFYGNAAYDANRAAMDAAVTINTPLTVDAQGTVYFGFVVAGANPLNLTGGVARVDASGKGSWVAVADAAADPAMVKPQTSAAPALSPDGKTLYVAVDATATSGNTRTTGYLVALDSATLAPRARVRLLDPLTGQAATVVDSGTASPAVGPDGDVYLGVLAPSGSKHAFLGWLLHYDADLKVTKTPGGFGWDYTPSVVPASAVGGYAGTSSYLLVAKYNEYTSGQHRIAVLDPNAARADRLESTVQVMQEVITILSPTRVEPADPSKPFGLTEWCINTPAVDVATRSAFVNNADGNLYRWDLATNTLRESFNLNAGYYQSYTPVALGPDGKVYAINNAVLNVVGQ